MTVTINGRTISVATASGMKTLAAEMQTAGVSEVKAAADGQTFTLPLSMVLRSAGLVRHIG